MCRSLLSLLEALVKIGKEGLDFHSLIKSLEEVAHTQQSGLIPKQVRPKSPKHRVHEYPKHRDM